MKNLPYLLILLVGILFSCQENEDPQGIEETFWVYSYPVPCIMPSNEPSTCLGISYAEEFDFNWPALERIPFEIEGFTFKQTYIQQVLVSKIENATTGEIKRKLIRVLSQEKDFYELIEGGWIVKKYLSEDLPNDKFPDGKSVSILPGARIALSTDGCNQIILEIQKVGPDKILSYGNVTSTAKACPGELPIPAFPGLGANFKREGNILTFFSEEEGEVAIWEKIN